MHYLHHNFMSNFTAGLNAHNVDMTKSLFIHEVSDFIVYDTAKLVTALKNSGIKASVKDTDEELIELIANNLSTNINLPRTLAFIIAEANELVNNGGNPDKWKQVIETLSGGITTIGQNIAKSDASKEAFKKDVLEHVYSKALAKGNYKRTILKKNKKSNTVPIVLGIFALVGITIYIVYRVQKKQLAMQNAANNPMIVPPIVPNASTNINPASSSLTQPPLQSNSGVDTNHVSANPALNQPISNNTQIPSPNVNNNGNGIEPNKIAA